MAKIKLEMSEYELMKENISLLKESLFREQELADQLAEANASNVKVLIANVKNEVYDSLSKKAKKALESNPIILEENHDLRKELKLVSDRLKVSKSIESQRVKDIDRLYKKQEYQQKMYLKFDAIDLIVPEKTPIFGNRKIVKEINEIINREI